VSAVTIDVGVVGHKVMFGHGHGDLAFQQCGARLQKGADGGVDDEGDGVLANRSYYKPLFMDGAVVHRLAHFDDGARLELALNLRFDKAARKGGT
jgi:hypothetical protein